MLMGIKGRDYIRTVFTGSDFGLFTYFLITHPSGETVKAHEGLNLSLIFDSANVGHFKEIVTKMNSFFFDYSGEHHVYRSNDFHWSEDEHVSCHCLRQNPGNDTTQKCD